MPEDQKPQDQEPQQDKPEPTEQEKLAEALGEMVGALEVEGAGQTMVTRLDAVSSTWRQTWTRILKHTDAEAYAEYKAKKYPPGVENPDINVRRAAYEFAVVSVIDKQVTDIEPLEATPEQIAVVGLVRQAVAVLKAISPDDYETIVTILKADAYSVENRKATYRSAAKLFLAKAYKLANV